MSEPSGSIRSRNPKDRAPNGTSALADDRPPSSAEVRPFRGFDRERSTYLQSRPGLLDRASGMFIAIVGDDLEGPVSTFEEAERAGYRRFGLGPLFIKQVLADEPAQEVSRDIHSRETKPPVLLVS